MPRIFALKDRLRQVGPVLEEPLFDQNGIDLPRLALGSLSVVRTFAIPAALIALITGGLAKLLLAPRYEARTAFVTEPSRTGRLPSTLVGLAGQLGLDLPGQTERSARFYGTLAKSSAILDRVLSHRFRVPTRRPSLPWKMPPAPGDSTASLAALLLERQPQTPTDTLRARRKLESALATRIDERTGIVELSVRSPDRWLAAWIANDFVASIDTFNVTIRRSSGSLERQFLERQVEGARDSLLTSEQRLERFYEANRNWQDAPRLAFVESTLRRHVTMTQDLYLALSRQLSEARIQEVNDIPVITQIERASPPEKPIAPRPIIVALSVGLFALAAPLGLWLIQTAALDRRRRLSARKESTLDAASGVRT